MKKRNRWLVLIIGIVMSLLLTACGGQKTDSNASNSNTKSAEKLAQGITKNEILIGHLGPQSGPVAIYDEIRMGIESYFNYVNENGGVNGRKLKLISYDDQYQPAKTVQFARRLVEEDKVFAMVANACTACNMAAKDYYAQKGIPYVMVGTGSKAFVDPPVKNFMGLLVMNYEVEAQIFLDYAVKHLHAKNIALAYQNDDFGKTGYGAVKEAIKKYPGVKIVEEVPFLATDTEFSSQAQKLNNAKPDVILNFATPNPAANLKKAMYKIGLKDPAYLVSSVGANDNSLFDLAGKDVWDGTYSGAVYSLPDKTSKDEKMKLYIERMSKDYPDAISSHSMGGWAAAQVLVEGLKKSGDQLTWENFLNKLNSFDNWDGSLYKGVTFSKDNHYGLTTMFLTQAKGGKITPISDEISFDPATGKVNYK